MCAAFLRTLVRRGLRLEPGLLCVIDGAKGLRTAIRTVFGAQVLVQHGQWHKRENIVRYLPKTQQAAWRRRLQQTYERLTYARLGRLWADSARSCRGSTPLPWPAWTKAWRRH